MKKTQKKILGFLGLGLVVAVTAIAAALPMPGASATTNVTDTISVRVVGEVAAVRITAPKSETVFIEPDQSIGINYENASEVKVALKYTDGKGVVKNYTLDEFDADYYYGEKTYNLDLAGAEYGYGEYVVTVSGKALDGVVAENTIKFYYHPVDIEINGDNSDPSDPGDDDGEGNVKGELGFDSNTAWVEINVYEDQGGTGLVECLSPTIVKAPSKDFSLPFSKCNMEEGYYWLSFTAYNVDGEELYTIWKQIYYRKPIETPKAADTGGLFQGLNISKADYLTTGLIVFGIVGVGGAIFISKRNRKSNSRRRR